MLIRAVQRRRPRFTTGVILGIGALAATVLGAIIAMGAIQGNFEIDANAQTSNAGTAAKPYYKDAFYTQTANDWVKDAGTGKGLFQLGGSGTAAINCYNSNIDKNPLATDYQLAFICDGSSDSKFSGRGSSLATEPEEDGVSPSGKQIDSSWPITATNVNAKDDFTHAMLAFTRNHTSPCAGGQAGNDPIIYLAGDRGDNEGDAFWGFEFDQVAPDNFDSLKNHAGGSYNLVFHRTVGDILVSFTNTGGGDVLLEVFVWNGSTFVLQTPISGCTQSKPTGDSELSTNGGTIEAAAPPWNIPVCDPTVSDGGGNTCRLASLTGGSGVGGKGNPGAFAIAPRDFMEASVDLHAFGLDDLCANNVIFTSRSAHPLESADLKDVAAQTLNVCHPATELTLVSQTPADPVYAGTEITIVVQEKNSGDVNLTNVNVDGTGCTTWTAAANKNGGAGAFSDSLLPGESVDFTCKFTPTSDATWTADGHATDTQGAAAPSDNEHQSGSVNTISPATTLTKVSQSPADPVYAGDSITIVVKEANTGDDTLTSVGVTGTNSCATWTAATNLNAPDAGTAFSGSLAPGQSVNFTCIFTIGSSDVSWTADGTGTDSKGGAVPATNEHQSGSVDVIHPATTLTKVSQTPADPVYANTSITIVVKEANTGDATLTGVSVTGTSSCATWTAATNLNAPDAGTTFSGSLAAGQSVNFTCIFTIGSTDVTWTADGHGKDPNLKDVPTTNEHQSGSVDVIHPSTSLSADALAVVTITYTYSELNDGDVPLTGATVTDDKCGTATYSSGDNSNVGVLDPNETWVFTCTKTSALTVDTFPSATWPATDSVQNTGIGSGTDPKNSVITFCVNAPNGTTICKATEKASTTVSVTASKP